MIYKVKALFNPNKIREFYAKLTDGTIYNRPPDGPEIVDSMKRAKISQSNVIEWYEKCFCPSPLQHERTTVYDFYFSHIQTEVAHDYHELEGESFWEYLKNTAE